MLFLFIFLIEVVIATLPIQIDPSLGCPNQIGVCVVGEYRSFGTDVVQDGIKNMIQRIEEKLRMKSKVIAVLSNPPTTPLKSSYYEKIILLDKDWGYPKDIDHPGKLYENTCLLNPRFNPKATDKFGQVFRKQFEKVHFCFREIEKEERRNGCKFKFLVRMRSDVVYFLHKDLFKEFSPEKINLNGEFEYSISKAGGVGDHFSIVRRDIAPTYFNSYNLTNLICEPLGVFIPFCHDGTGWMGDNSAPPECLLSFYFHKMSIQVNRMWVPLDPIRMDGRSRSEVMSGGRRDWIGGNSPPRVYHN